MSLPVWYLPISIDKNNSLEEKIIVDGCEHLKLQQCLHCACLPCTEKGQGWRTEPFSSLIPATKPGSLLGPRTVPRTAPKGSVGKSPSASACHGSTMPLHTQSHTLCCETTAQLACGTNLTELIRSGALWNKTHTVTPWFKAAGSAEGQSCAM